MHSSMLISTQPLRKMGKNLNAIETNSTLHETTPNQGFHGLPTFRSQIQTCLIGILVVQLVDFGKASPSTENFEKKCDG